MWKKKIFGYGKYFFRGGEEKKRKKRRKIFGEGTNIFFGGEEKRRRKKRKIFGEGYYFTICFFVGAAVSVMRIELNIG